MIWANKNKLKTDGNSLPVMVARAGGFDILNVFTNFKLPKSEVNYKN